MASMLSPIVSLSAFATSSISFEPAPYPIFSGLNEGYVSEYFETRLTVIAAPVGVLSSAFACPRSMAKWFLRRISATAGGGLGYVRFENRVVPPPTATGEDHHVALSSPNDSARHATP